MTYNELLIGLMYSDERILSRDPHLQYTSLSFYDECFNLKQSKTGGVAVITDKRMLFLSSQYARSKLSLGKLHLLLQKHKAIPKCCFNV